jgi:hypothetical protein
LKKKVDNKYKTIAIRHCENRHQILKQTGQSPNKGTFLFRKNQVPIDSQHVKNNRMISQTASNHEWQNLPNTRDVHTCTILV